MSALLCSSRSAPSTSTKEFRQTLIPMIQEAACVILTSSKIGPVHSVVFAILGEITERSHYGRSVRAGRDCQRESEKEQVMALKSIINAAITDRPFVTTCLVFRRTVATTKRLRR